MGNERRPRQGHQKRTSKTTPPGGGGGGQAWSRAWRSLSSASALSLALVASAFP